ncbi:MAG: GTP-binding protein [Phycisphaerae bacterium]|jgi:Ni2+-binding GTPase involved in maturation of urease and hydrogenase
MANPHRSQPNIRFIMLGGFLGSGKTSALLRLARGYVAAGLRVGIITNDYGEELVDTATFRTAGFATEEIPKGCFCRRLDELLAAAGRLQDGGRPDVLLAEPAGSGTNLVNTVIKPLKEVYADRFTVMPYAALLDPQRALEALSANGRGGFSAKVLYLYKMQQNEADIVAINKIDTISAGQLDELTALVARNFPAARVLALSARTGEGFAEFAALLDGSASAGRNAIAPGDVDRAAVDEALGRLGWLNAGWEVDAAAGVDADELLLEVAEATRRALADVTAEPAHVKLVLRCGEGLGVVNLISSDRPPELSRPLRARVRTGTLQINARAEIDEHRLRAVVEEVMRRTPGVHTE